MGLRGWWRVNVDVADLSAYLALVDAGHFGRAAASVHLTRSGLSRAVRRVEAAVGEQLGAGTPRACTG